MRNNSHATLTDVRTPVNTLAFVPVEQLRARQEYADFLESRVNQLARKAENVRDQRDRLTQILGLVRQQMRFWKPGGTVAMNVKDDLLEQIDKALEIAAVHDVQLTGANKNG